MMTHQKIENAKIKASDMKETKDNLRQKTQIIITNNIHKEKQARHKIK